MYDTIAPFVEEGWETVISGEASDQSIFLFTNGTVIETTKEEIVHDIYKPLVELAFKDTSLAILYLHSSVSEIAELAKKALED